MSRIALAIATAVALQSAQQFAPLNPDVTYTQASTRYAYGAGAAGRRYFHPMLGRWVLTA
mgnify:FL=1